MVEEELVEKSVLETWLTGAQRRRLLSHRLAEELGEIAGEEDQRRKMQAVRIEL